MSDTNIAHFGALGLCEHCSCLQNITNMPSDAQDSEWRCKSCKGILTHKSFGYEEVEGNWKKVKWVGPGKAWIEVEPEEDYEIDNIHVCIKIPHPIY